MCLLTITISQKVSWAGKCALYMNKKHLAGARRKGKSGFCQARVLSKLRGLPSVFLLAKLDKESQFMEIHCRNLYYKIKQD